MGQYTTKGLYNAYDKNHKERDKLDYYATPTAEVINILKALNIDFSYQTILEPCVGGGHMAEGILHYLSDGFETVDLIGTDIKDRGYTNDYWKLEYGLDFFADDYPYNEADWIIMNPPYSVIEPFTIRALEIAKKGNNYVSSSAILRGRR